MKVIKKANMPEGLLLNRYFKNRMISRNQNVLVAVTGSTGSGKSYACLRIAELWYRYNFNEDFPMNHVCFSVEEVMRLLSSKENKIRMGDVIIFEEAGTQIGSLDFQTKISKMFTYVLQSFRSMNVGIIMNLPVLSMLNKSARLLLHCHAITSGINYQNKTCKLKPFFHQLNQQSGKVYPKYMRAKVDGKTKKIQRFTYSLPRADLISQYETKKLKFVSELNEEFVKKLDEDRSKEELKMGRHELEDYHKDIMEDMELGLTQTECAIKRGRTQQGVSSMIKTIKKWGYKIKYPKNTK